MSRRGHLFVHPPGSGMEQSTPELQVLVFDLKKFRHGSRCSGRSRANSIPSGCLGDAGNCDELDCRCRAWSCSLMHKSRTLAYTCDLASSFASKLSMRDRSPLAVRRSALRSVWLVSWTLVRDMQDSCDQEGEHFTNVTGAFDMHVVLKPKPGLSCLPQHLVHK